MSPYAKCDPHWRKAIAHHEFHPPILAAAPHVPVTYDRLRTSVEFLIQVAPPPQTGGNGCLAVAVKWQMTAEHAIERGGKNSDARDGRCSRGDVTPLSVLLRTIYNCSRVKPCRLAHTHSVQAQQGGTGTHHHKIGVPESVLNRPGAVGSIPFVSEAVAMADGINLLSAFVGNCL